MTHCALFRLLGFSIYEIIDANNSGLANTQGIDIYFDNSPKDPAFCLVHIDFSAFKSSSPLKAKTQYLFYACLLGDLHQQSIDTQRHSGTCRQAGFECGKQM